MDASETTIPHDPAMQARAAARAEEQLSRAWEIYVGLILSGGYDPRECEAAARAALETAKAATQIWMAYQQEVEVEPPADPDADLEDDDLLVPWGKVRPLMQNFADQIVALSEQAIRRALNLKTPAGGDQEVL